MKVLFIASPGVGHAQPMRPLVRAFQEAGHDAAVAVSEHLPRSLFDESVPRFAKGPNRFPMNPLPRGPERVAWWREHNIRMARESFADSLEIIRSYGPDLIVRDCSERGGHLAAEKCSVPHITMLTDSLSVLREYLADEASLTAGLRFEVGLSEDGEGATQVPLMGLSFALPRFYGPEHNLVPNSRFFHRATPTSDPRAGRSERGERVVLVTLGTTVGVPHADFMRMILQGVWRVGVRVVAAVPESDRPELAASFPEAEILGFVPLAEHIARADLVVSHGGFGTVTNALTRGIPLHLTPFHSDQFFNAERVQGVGVGAVLDWAECSPEALRDSVLTALHSSSLKASARNFMREMNALPDLSHCVAVMEQELG